MLKNWIFSHPVFNNIFTVNILGMWEKRRGFTPMKGCSPSLSQYCNGLFQEKTKEGGGG